MTYSAIGLDRTKEFMVVATATKTPAVGESVPAVIPGVGGVVSQAFTNKALRGLALEALGLGLSAQQALELALSDDEQPELRQLALMDASGNFAVHTGSGCSAVAGSFATDGFLCVGNLLRNEKVLSAMADNWRLVEGPVDLLEAALNCLRAGELAGGDSRGQQSAALIIAGMDQSGEKLMEEFRVDDSESPLTELAELVESWISARAPSA